MTGRRLLQPPEIIEIDEPIIFLAGPIQGAPDWQQKAARLIHRQAPHIVVASPRKDYLDGTFVHEKQVDWETYNLRAAGKLGVVAFWLAKQTIETPGRAYAQTTRFELAEWKMRHQYEGAKLTLGIEEDFGNERYIRRRFAQDCPDVLITKSLAAMCLNAVDLVQEIA
jgi:hypothetical protein